MKKVWSYIRLSLPMLQKDHLRPLNLPQLEFKDPDRTRYQILPCEGKVMQRCRYYALPGTWTGSKDFIKMTTVSVTVCGYQVRMIWCFSIQVSLTRQDLHYPNKVLKGLSNPLKVGVTDVVPHNLWWRTSDQEAPHWNTEIDFPTLPRTLPVYFYCYDE